jgi:hypothetical protein
VNANSAAPRVLPLGRGFVGTAGNGADFSPELLSAPPRRSYTAAQLRVLAIRVHGRARFVYLLACSLRFRQRGLTVERAAKLLAIVNEALCAPSLGDAEVRRIAAQQSEGACDVSPLHG